MSLQTSVSVNHHGPTREAGDSYSQVLAGAESGLPLEAKNKRIARVAMLEWVAGCSTSQPDRS